MIEMRPGGEPVSDVQAFVERVMAAVEVEPVPTPARTLVTSLRGHSIVDAAAAVATAWHLATVSGRRIAPSVRMRSMALVLSVAAVLAMGGSLATAAAVRVVERAVANQQDTVPNGPGAGEQGPAEDGQKGVQEPGTVDQDVAEPDDDGEPPLDDETDGATAKDAPENEDDADEDTPGSDDSDDADEADRDHDDADEADAADEDDADAADEDDADAADEDDADAADEDDADEVDDRDGSGSDREDGE
jgi:hypothetical protein